MRWFHSPIRNLFLILFWLNILDVLVTIPAYEANPFTLYLWGKMGIFLSAWLKIGLVLLLAGLCQLTKMTATLPEWAYSKKIFNGILVVLVAFYIFVVVWNTILFISVNL